mmetsp:Transcript_38104/g.68098  ORF Transcript_38104/g.68098 Transcript_38104/m.68098 type:complete len:223 (-) Transcript_38104:232-900(-)
MPVANSAPELSPPWLATFRSLVNLRSKVKLHVALVLTLQVILHQKGRVRSKPQSHRAAQWGCLGEVHQISKCKVGGDRLVHSKADFILWLVRLVGLQQDIAAADVTGHHKLEPFFAAIQLHSVPKLLQILADPQELGRWHLCNHFVMLLRNLHDLTLDVHELEVKISNAIIRTLVLEAHHLRVHLVANLHRVRGAGHLHDHGERIHVDAERDGAIALELSKG